MSQNPLVKQLPGQPPPFSARTFAAYSNAARSQLRAPTRALPPQNGVPVRSDAPVRIFEVSSISGLGGGVYAVNLHEFFAASGFDPAAQFVINDYISTAVLESAYVVNIAESGFNTHRIGVGVIFICWLTRLTATDGKRVYITNYAHSIRWWRYNETTHEVQVSYQDAESIDDVTSWVDAADVDPCA